MERLRQLTDRRRALQRECAEQRVVLGRQSAQIHQSLGAVDRAYGLVQQVRQKPLLLAAAGALVLVLAPKGSLRWALRGAALFATVRQFGGNVLKVADKLELLRSHRDKSRATHDHR